LQLLTALNKSYFIPELQLKQASPWEADPVQEIKSFFLAGSLSAGSLPIQQENGHGSLTHLKFLFLFSVFVARYLGKPRNEGASG
jgi:hypothetical protein